MIREDRLLLAELGRLNTDVVPLARSGIGCCGNDWTDSAAAEDGECVRLALLYLTVLDRHTVDGNGTMPVRPDTA
ncbi:MAG: hypothetical protein M3Y48_18475 [Actinomycetota bacterium]|nr:hypothetical protein [Actinomycetota bacterium]